MSREDRAHEQKIQVYWRVTTVHKNGIIDTAGALQVGFLNYGDTHCQVNGLTLPFPAKVGLLPPSTYIQSAFFFPINDSERDSTAYRVIFTKPYKNPGLYVFVKLIKRNTATDDENEY